MKILETLASADPASGGPLAGLVDHAKIWTQDGHTCEVVTLDPPDAPYLKDTPLKVHALGTENTLPEGLRRLALPLRYGYRKAYVPWLRANVKNYDAVIVNGLWTYATFGARQVLPNSGVPYFVFSHGMLDPWFRKVSPVKNAGKQVSWLINEGPLMNNARAVLFTTEEEREVSRNAFWPYHVREKVVGYGTADVSGDPAQQIAAFRKAVPELGDRRYLLFLSRIHPKKGCDLLFQGFAKVASEDPGLDLVIAGPDQVGLRAGLEKIAAAEGVAERIHWTGMVTGDVKMGALRACEAFVLPSHQENFGVAVVEALACSRPVIISNKVNIWREIETAGAGLIAEDTLEGTIATLKAFLKLSPEERRTMGEAGRRLFLDKFHIEMAAKTLLEVVKAESEDVHP